MAGSAGRPTRRVTDSSYGSRGHPNRGERASPNQRLKLTGAAVQAFRAARTGSAESVSPSEYVSVLPQPASSRRSPGQRRSVQFRHGVPFPARTLRREKRLYTRSDDVENRSDDVENKCSPTTRGLSVRRLLQLC